MAESEFTRRCMKLATSFGARLFRNNVGQAWVANKIIDLPGGDKRLVNPRPFHAGLAAGSADLIGWVPLLITADMVGQTVAVFTSVETKSAKGRARAGQPEWAEAVRNSGGYSGFARTDADLNDILCGRLPPKQPVAKGPT
jgi:hypothetical protein